MDFDKYIKGKRVAVVGPAGYLSDFNNKDLIENHDIVMRFNAALPIHDNLIPNIGSRTDILCNGLDGVANSCGEYNSKLWSKLGVKWVFCPYWSGLPHIMRYQKKFASHNQGLIPMHFADKRSFCDVNNALVTNPNTGLLGVMYLLHHDIKEVFLTGFSFGLGEQYCLGYKEKIARKYSSIKSHDQKEQLAYFKEQYQKHKDIINVDSTLKNILTN